MLAPGQLAAVHPADHLRSSLTALGLSLRTAAASTVLCVLFGVPLALVLARGDVPRPAAAALLRPAAAGAAAGGGRHRAALHLRPPGPAGAEPRGRRHPDRVLHDRGGARPDLRGPAVPGGQPRRRPAHGRQPVRGGRRDPRRAPDHRAAPGHPAAGAARPGLRRRAVLRPQPGRIRRHPHLRRQPAGRHPHAAAGDLPAARDRRRRRRRAVPAAGRGGGRRRRALLPAPAPAARHRKAALR